MVVLARFHFSEVQFRVFKGQRAFDLNPWRFLSVLRGSIDLCLLRAIVPRFGFPTSIGSDNGPAFVADLV